MNTTIKQVAAFRTTDGRLWDNEADATERQARIDVGVWCEKAGIGRGGEWDADTVAGVMLDDAATLARLLQAVSPGGRKS